jgi:hypothetical protein
MIDKCDDEIACWSELGDNFVVKNVDKFASVSTEVLSVNVGVSQFLNQYRQLTNSRISIERVTSLFQT